MLIHHFASELKCSNWIVSSNCTIEFTTTRRKHQNNIKFHGTLFRESQEYVNLAPADCFALATYKIHGALRRQDQEFSPYVFLVISVPEFNRTFRGAEINMHLSLSSEMMAFSDFLQILAETGVQGISVRLERGEI